MILCGRGRVAGNRRTATRAAAISGTNDQCVTALALVAAALGPAQTIAALGAAATEYVIILLELQPAIRAKLGKRLGGGIGGELCGPRHEKPPYRAYTW